MSLTLQRMVYESTATGTTGSLTNLAVILSVSQYNNVRDGLTGALAAHRDRYIQVVEGTPQALDGLLRRLELDPRHRHIVLLDRIPISERMFDGWSMANAQITPALAPILDALMIDARPSPSWIVLAMRDAVETSLAAE